MKKHILSCLFIVFFAFAYGQKNAEIDEYEPWYTGPLLTSSATNLDPGFSNVQPYLFLTETYPDHGANMYDLEASSYIQYGLLDFLDVTFYLRVLYNEQEHKQYFGFADTNITFGIQLLHQVKHTAIPAIRLTIGETFPTGKYRNLNPDIFGIDALGHGQFATKISLNFSKVVYWIKNHPISFRLVFPFSISPRVLVKEFNNYGGGYNAYGKIKQPISFSPDFSFEYSFNQRWVWAMEFRYEYNSKAEFSGYPGTTEDGELSSCGSDATHAVSILPAIEYNINENYGYLAGMMIPVYRKNTSFYLGYIVSFTYTF